MDTAFLSERTELFRGMSPQEIHEGLSFFRAQRRTYQKGECFVRMGDRLPGFGLVISGAVQVSMIDLNGNRMIMANVSAGGAFGESLSFLNVQASPIYITAAADSEVLWLDTEGLRQPQSAPSGQMLVQRFITVLAKRALGMNDRIQILSKKTLRGKLIAFFSQQIKRSGGTAFTLDLDRGDMADYLGTDRSALSRELSAMRREGLLDFHKNQFVLLHARAFEE